jgi:AcrR family transcriptional regulator
MVAQPSRQSLRSSDARDHIVQAALNVFAVKGTSAASMDDICLAARCSKGGLYHHFRSRKAILEGVIDRLARERGLLPPFSAPAAALGLSEEGLGYVVVELWSEASRQDALRDRVREAYEAALEDHLSDAAWKPTVAEILRMGSLIQLLTTGDSLDAAAVSRRLGIPRAA